MENRRALTSGLNGGKRIEVRIRQDSTVHTVGEGQTRQEEEVMKPGDDAELEKPQLAHTPWHCVKSGCFHTTSGLLVAVEQRCRCRSRRLLSRATGCDVPWVEVKDREGFLMCFSKDLSPQGVQR